MVRDGVTVGFTGLRHDVTDVDFHGIGTLYCVNNAFDDEIRHDAGIETPRSDDNNIGVQQCVYRFVVCLAFVGFALLFIPMVRFAILAPLKKDALDGFAVLAFGDSRFAADNLAIGEFGAEHGVV